MDVVVFLDSALPMVKFNSQEADGWRTIDGQLDILRGEKRVASFANWLWVRFSEPQRVDTKSASSKIVESLRVSGVSE